MVRHGRLIPVGLAAGILAASVAFGGPAAAVEPSPVTIVGPSPLPVVVEGPVTVDADQFDILVWIGGALLMVSIARLVHGWSR